MSKLDQELVRAHFMVSGLDNTNLCYLRNL